MGLPDKVIFTLAYSCNSQSVFEAAKEVRGRFRGIHLFHFGKMPSDAPRKEPKALIPGQKARVRIGVYQNQQSDILFVP